MRRSQVDRRRASRDALLEAGARHLSRFGYGSLSLDRLAREAGYTRGALYHQFQGKDAFVLAVVGWVEERWYDEVFAQIPATADPAAALVAVAQAHAVFCRRDVARVGMALRVEFAGRDHPVGRAVAATVARVVGDCAALVERGRRSGDIPAGVPSEILAEAIVHAVEGVVAGVGGGRHVPYDELLAAAVTRGLLGGASGQEPRRSP